MNISSPVSLLVRRFPGCAHWMQLRAFTGALAFAVGIVIGNELQLHYSVTPGRLYLFFLAGATAATIIAVLSRNRFVSMMVLCAAGILVSMMHGERDAYLFAELERIREQKVVITGDISSPPAPRRDRFVWLLKLREVEGTRDSPLCGRTFMCTGTEMPEAAGSSTLEGYLSPGRSRNNRYDFDEQAMFRAGSITGRIVVERILGSLPPQSLRGKLAAWFRAQVVGVLKTYPDPDHRAVVRASFLNEKAYLAPEIKDAFRASGLYHLLSLSGLHAGILLAAVYFLLSLFPVPMRVRHLSALSVLWLYYLYIGAVPSLARATVMATVVIVALLLQRKNYPLQSLGIAALVWLWWSPASLGQAGFQFSFLATFGILTLHPLIMRSYPGHAHPVVDYAIRLLLTPFSVSFAAFCATLPAMAWHFGTLSLFGLIANIIGATIMTAGMWLFFFGLLCAPLIPFVSRAAIHGSSLFLDGLLSLAESARSVPASIVNIPAPYPELIAGVFLLLTAIVTVADSARKKLLVWLLPMFCCCIPASYLVRRAGAGVQVVRFAAAAPGTEVTAVRFRDGSAVLYCDGSDNAVERVIHYTVVPWIRHTPGTVIRSIYSASPERGSVPERIPQELLRFNGTVLQVMPGKGNGAPACTCSYNATGWMPVVTVRYGRGTVRCRGKDVTWSLFPDSSAVSGRAEAPVKITLHPTRCSSRPMN